MNKSEPREQMGITDKEYNAEATRLAWSEWA